MAGSRTRIYTYQLARQLTCLVKPKTPKSPWWLTLRIMADVPKTCTVILADTVAKKLINEVHETLATIQRPDDAKPSLAAFLANDDPAAVKYAEWSKKTCEEK